MKIIIIVLFVFSFGHINEGAIEKIDRKPAIQKLFGWSFKRRDTFRLFSSLFTSKNQRIAGV